MKLRSKISKENICTAIRFVVFILLLTGCFRVWNALIKPDTSIEGGRNENSLAVYNGFENLPKDSLDYICIGSSNVFMNINPLHIFKEYGLYGYNYASPMQTIYQSYFYLEHAFETQKPKIVLLDALGIAAVEHNEEAFSHLGYDYFPLSYEKYCSYQNVSYEKESYAFPFLRYHTRWNELTKLDFERNTYREEEDFLGYTPALTTSVCAGNFYFDDGREYVILERNQTYVQKIAKLCEDNGSKLLLIKAPNTAWTRGQSEATAQLAQKLGLTFIDFNAPLEDYSINLQEDFCDGSSHMTIMGANRLSDYLGTHVLNGLEKRNSPELSAYYEKRYFHLERFNQNYKMRTQVDFKQYLSDVQNDSYLLLATAKISDRTIPVLKELASDIKWKQKKNTNACLVLQNGQTQAKKVAKSSKLEYSLDEHVFYLERNVVKEGNTAVKGSKIQADYVNYGKDGAVNLVLWDTTLEKVVDTFCVEQTAEGALLIHRE